MKSPREWGQGLYYMARFAERQLYCLKKRARLKNRDFTIIATNCVGTMIYHDLGLPYLSPTINLTISMRDMVKLAGDLKGYLQQELVELPQDGYPPPPPGGSGLLGDIRVNFVHYDSFEEGRKKWEERRQRIRWDNLFLIGTERGDCDYDILQRFDRLPYPHKAVLTHVEYPEFSSAYYIKGFENQEEIGTVTDFKPQLLMRRYMDDFDYISFLNEGKGET